MPPSRMWAGGSSTIACSSKAWILAKLSVKAKSGSCLLSMASKGVSAVSVVMVVKSKCCCSCFDNANACAKLRRNLSKSVGFAEPKPMRPPMRSISLISLKVCLSNSNAAIGNVISCSTASSLRLIRVTLRSGRCK